MRQIGRGLLVVVCVATMCLSSSLLRGQSQKDAFAGYTGCSIGEGPAIVETAPLAPGVTTRTVQTLHGSFDVLMTEGRRVMFAYPDEDFYANVKVELLPAEGYGQSKAALIDNLEYILASGDNTRNFALKPKLNGFEIQGLDRSKREGGVLGVYLLFDDVTRTVVTIYFLKQEPPKRFKTMEEYAVLRDRFLNSYTSCIRTHL
jgi:hypothetical protein